MLLLILLLSLAGCGGSKGVTLGGALDQPAVGPSSNIWPPNARRTSAIKPVVLVSAVQDGLYTQLECRCTLPGQYTLGSNPDGSIEAGKVNLNYGLSATGPWTPCPGDAVSGGACQNVSLRDDLGNDVIDGHIKRKVQLPGAPGDTVYVRGHFVPGDNIKAYLNGVLTNQQLASSFSEAAVSVVLGGEPPNLAPTVSLSGPESVDAGATVTLTTTASDPEDDTLTLEYTYNGPDGGTLVAGPSGAEFTAPAVDSDTVIGILVTVYDTHDNVASASISITVIAPPAPNQPPVASLTATPASGLAPLSVTLDASASADSDGTVVSYDYDFDGDGEYDALDAGATLAHDYPLPGSYTAIVRVTDDDGAQSVASAEIAVDNNAPIASLSASPSGGDGPLNVFLDASASSDSDGGIVNYSFDFSDGSDPSAGSGFGVSHVYLDAGSYVATVTVTDNFGATGSTSVPIEVTLANQPPLAALAAVPDAGDAPLTVAFDASGSSDPDGSVVSYSYLFGDGAPETSGGATIEHTYASMGSYTASVTVMDNSGATATASVDLTITPANLIPEAVLVVQPDSGDSPLQVNFNAGGSSDPDGTIASFSFDFGDGATSSGVTPSAMHTYTTPGVYTASVTVTDNDGATGSATQQINVTAPNIAPTAVLTATPPSGDGPLTVQFDGSASFDQDGTVVRYEWDFTGTGTFVDLNQQSPSWQYLLLGDVHPALRVTDNRGATSTASITVTVKNPVTAAIAASGSNGPYNPATGIAPLGVVLNAGGSTSTAGSIVQYEWDFNGDGTYDQDTGATATVAHTYTTAGTYTTTVRVTDSEGYQNTAALTVWAQQWATGTAQSVGFGPLWISAALVSGKPSIAYEDNNGSSDRAMYLRGSNANGSAGFSLSSISNFADRNDSISLMQLPSGLPALSYAETANSSPGNRTLFAWSGVLSGWSGGGGLAVNNEPGGRYRSMAIVGGKPGIAYVANSPSSNGPVRYAYSNNAAGTAGWSAVTAATARLNTSVCSLADVGGHPGIIYGKPGGSADGVGFAYNSAADGSGTWVTSTVDTDNAANAVFTNYSLGSLNGKPIVVYGKLANVSGATFLRYATNSQSDGTGTWTVTSINVNGVFSDAGSQHSIAIINGRPAIAYRSSTGLGSETGNSPAGVCFVYQLNNTSWARKYVETGDAAVEGSTMFQYVSLCALESGGAGIAYRRGSNVKWAYLQ